MFPAEQLSILNTVTRGIMGQPGSINGGSFLNLLDEASIEKIATSAWERFWKKFLIFGNISAGVIGIYMAIRIIKLILDTIVHGYALHTVYRWSMYLLGAIWDLLTQFLLHLGKEKPSKPKRPVASAPAESDSNNRTVRFSELPDDLAREHVYPLLPPGRRNPLILSN